MYCYRCDKYNVPSGAKHCPNCGAQLYYTQETMDAAQNGDRAAQEILCNCVADAMYQIIRFHINDREVAHDLMQDAMIRVLLHFGELREASKFKAWAKAIAHNLTVDYLRKNNAVNFTDLKSESSDFDDDVEIEFEDTKPDFQPEIQFDLKERHAIVEELLSCLPAEQKVIVAEHMEGATFREIAQRYGISENTVKSRYKYAFKKLDAKRSDMEKKGYKLYSIAGLPLLLLLLKNEDVFAAEISVTTITEQAMQQAAVQAASSAAQEVTRHEIEKRAVSAGSKAAKAAASSAGKGAAIKAIAGIAAVALIGGGAAFGIHQINQDKAAEPIAVEESAPIMETDDLEIVDEAAVLAERRAASEKSYGAVVNKYAAALEDNNFSSSSYSNMATNLLNYYHIYNNSDFYYAYYDIDGNGIDELIISNCPKDYDQYALVDLYTFDGNEAVRAIDNDTFGDRSTLTILSDGTIIEFVSGGADTNSSTYYQISADGYSLTEGEESNAAEVTSFSWTKIEVATASASNENSIADTNTMDFDFTGQYANEYGVQLVITKNGDTYTGKWSDEYNTPPELTLTPVNGTLQADVYGGGEILTITPKGNTADLIITGNEAFEGVKKYVKYDGEFVKTGSGSPSSVDTSHFTGSFSNGAIDLRLYMDGNTLKMDFGDDVVMGRTTFIFNSFNIQGDELIASDEHMTYYFTRNQDGSITLDTQGNAPEMEGVYDIQ